MAQRSVLQHQAFSVVEEESEDALLEEELTSQYPTRNRFRSFSGPTPDIQIDLVGDRIPSPDEPSYPVPVNQQQAEIKHAGASSGDEPDTKEASELRDKQQAIAAKRVPDAQEHHATVDSETSVSEPTTRGSDAGYARRKGAKEYMYSKPGSLPFVDDSPPGPGPAETPSEGTTSARVAASKSPQAAVEPEIQLAKDPSVRRFVEEYIRGISEQAQLLADERSRKSRPHAKYHSPTDGARASVIITTKRNEAPWYHRFREGLDGFLQLACSCIRIGRHPEAL